MRYSKNVVFCDAKGTAAVFSGTMAVLIAAFYYLARIGFEQYPVLILQALAVSLFFLSLPSAYLLWAKKVGFRPDKFWFTTDTAIGIAGIVIVCLAAYLPGSVRAYVLPLFTFSGFLFFLIVLRSWFKSAKRWQSFFFLAMVVVFTMWLFSIWVSMKYQEPLFEEQMVMGDVHIDTLYNSSISSMIKTYGVPSTGLDGIPYIPYHTGSHWLFAILSELLNTYPLRFYQLGFPVIFYPLFFYTLLSFSIDLRFKVSRSIKDVKNWNMRGDVMFWSILVLSHIGLLPMEWKRHFIGTFESHLYSESYRVSFIWLFLGFSLILKYFDMSWIRLKSPASTDFLFLVIFLPIFVCASGFFKISAMILIFLVFIYMFLKLALYNSLPHIFSFFSIVFAFLITYRLTFFPYGELTDFSFFPYMEKYVTYFARSYFFLLHYFFAWLFIIWKLHYLRIRTVLDVKEAWNRNTILDIEILIIFCVFGSLPGLLLSTSGGNAYYFSDVQRWVALSFLLGHVPIFTRNWQIKKNTFPATFWNIQLKHIAIGLVGLMFFASISFDALPTMINVLKDNYSTRLSVLGVEGGELPRAVKSVDIEKIVSFVTDRYEEKLSQKEHQKIIDVLAGLRDIPIEEKRETLLFIPKNNSRYWDLPTRRHCYAIPFIAPAMTGMAMINGLPEKDCQAKYYGYSLYSHRENNSFSGANALCAKAQRLGFSKIIVLRGAEDGELGINRISCNQSTFD